jgi:hypothetical protein
MFELQGDPDLDIFGCPEVLQRCASWCSFCPHATMMCACFRPTKQQRMSLARFDVLSSALGAGLRPFCADMMI